jgi:hypothetical protein
MRAAAPAITSAGSAPATIGAPSRVGSTMQRSTNRVCALSRSPHALSARRSLLLGRRRLNSTPSMHNRSLCGAVSAPVQRIASVVRLNSSRSAQAPHSA